MYELAAGLVRRVMNRIDSSQRVLGRFLHVVTAVHLAVYRASGGRLTGTGTMPAGCMILLTTTGRKSGAPRSVPLMSLRNDADWLIVASNAGLHKPPAWLFNLRANPDATVQDGRETTPVKAMIANDATRAELWPRFLEVYPGYADHERRAGREIPIVILSPAR